MMRLLRARLAGQPGDRGAIGTLFVIGTAVCALLVLGLVVDGGGTMRAAAAADAVAAQAARIAGQQLADGQAQASSNFILDQSAATQAGYDVLAAHGMTGSITVDGDRVTVTTQDTYDTIVLSFINWETIQVDGTATVQVTPGIDDEGVISP